ncbi:hypothetical protein [Bermanella sp. R86510]|uniref:hypothetical protein n=1 Tax=unclassified Bermanella TaxID=2627862 RepID=UPI0037CC18D0
MNLTSKTSLQLELDRQQNQAQETFLIGKNGISTFTKAIMSPREYFAFAVNAVLDTMLIADLIYPEN